MTVFVDTSAWFAAADADDASHARAVEVLTQEEALLTSDHVLVESWTLIRYRLGKTAARRFWEGLRAGVAVIEPVATADLEVAWEIGESFRDQDFSIVDRTSFAVMERLGITEAASFDNHFAVYRYGRSRDRAFRIIR